MSLRIDFKIFHDSTVTDSEVCHAWDSLGDFSFVRSDVLKGKIDDRINISLFDSVVVLLLRVEYYPLRKI